QGDLRARLLLLDERAQAGQSLGQGNGRRLEPRRNRAGPGDRPELRPPTLITSLRSAATSHGSIPADLSFTCWRGPRRTIMVPPNLQGREPWPITAPRISTMIPASP